MFVRAQRGGKRFDGHAFIFDASESFTSFSIHDIKYRAISPAMFPSRQ